MPNRRKEGEDQVEKETAIHFAGSGDGADHAAAGAGGHGVGGQQRHLRR